MQIQCLWKMQGVKKRLLIFGIGSMMKFSVLMLLLVFFLKADACMVFESPINCEIFPSNEIDGLFRIDCLAKNGVRVERYLGPNLSSEYSTEFDQRELVVAQGKNSVNVKSFAGINFGVRGNFSQKNMLNPPVQAQISKRILDGKVKKYRNWVISLEQIEYGAQGGRVGFPLSCATAIRELPGKTTIVAECFPLEGRKKFYEALDSVR